MSIPVSKVVKVSILSSPTFPARKGFGLLNIIGNSARLPVGDRIHFYSDMEGVAADFASTDEEYKAAQVFFSRWWLSRFRFGPMEWLWRWLTYGRRPAMRLAPAAV